MIAETELIAQYQLLVKTQDSLTTHRQRYESAYRLLRLEDRMKQDYSRVLESPEEQKARETRHNRRIPDESTRRAFWREYGKGSYYERRDARNGIIWFYRSQHYYGDLSGVSHV